jgi:hypothetical protein
MAGDTAKATISSKNISITLIVTLASAHGADITKTKNIVFIILLIFNNIFKFDYNII